MLSDLGDPYLDDEKGDRDGEDPIGEDLYSSCLALPPATSSYGSPSLRCHPLVCITRDAIRNIQDDHEEGAPYAGRPLRRPCGRLSYCGLSASLTCRSCFWPSLTTVS